MEIIIWIIVCAYLDLLCSAPQYRKTSNCYIKLSWTVFFSDQVKSGKAISCINWIVLYDVVYTFAYLFGSRLLVIPGIYKSRNVILLCIGAKAGWYITNLIALTWELMLWMLTCYLLLVLYKVLFWLVESWTRRCVMHSIFTSRPVA
jgi:hypothetical protein